MIKTCEKCHLFPAEIFTSSRKIKPSYVFCRDCVRIISLEEKDLESQEALLEKAKKLKREKGNISSSLLQRKFKITYTLANKILEQIEQ